MIDSALVVSPPYPILETGVTPMTPNRLTLIMSFEDNALSLRPATDEDWSFLKTVFASTRANELAALRDPALIDSFIDMQFNAQRQNYEMVYPDAENSIILLGERPVGRMIVDRKAKANRLVDISLLTEFRAQGIGSNLLRRLIDDTTATGKSLQLSVYKLNPAIRLYERLGFSRTTDDGTYVEMHCQPQSV